VKVEISMFKVYYFYGYALSNNTPPTCLNTQNLPTSILDPSAFQNVGIWRFSGKAGNRRLIYPYLGM